MSPSAPQKSLPAVITSEYGLVETPGIELLEELGWAHADLMEEQPGEATPTGRVSFRELVLPARLRVALRKLNPSLADEALQQAEIVLTKDRSAMLPVAANREVYSLLRDGIAVQVRRPDGSLQDERVAVIDWTAPAANDFFLGSQVWVESNLYSRRPDAIGFVNGIPLLLIEWKDITKPVQEAYDANLRDYRDTIPRLFDFNAVTILSNGLDALIGASHSPFDTFAPWKRLEEDGPESVALETMLRATCEPSRFLDLVESFLLFDDARGGLRKVLGKYHQVLGVNRAIAAVEQIGENRGKLGVFWHTQGSGKSFSMVMFAEKVLRRLGGNWTFVIITDRQELDVQIATTFASVGALTKLVKDCQAQSRAHLRELLAGQERYIFTLIHKFSTGRGEPMPVLSKRSDIIVITDEAHRSQYDQLAANMRRALPNAAFIGFTGTPLIAGQEERTREVFGDYVSVYNFAQSIADGATVPLYYEARKPELQLAVDELKDELDALLDEAALDEEQESKLQQTFGKQYHLITRNDRLDEIAADLVRHFSARGYLGKAMFVAIDKATAVRMYDKVQAAWGAELAAREEQYATASEEARLGLTERLMWMRSVDMAVVVSQSQNEIDDLKQKDLDILSHRARMQKEDLEAKFKDDADPLRLVFVCAMWITGFDVPTCSTVYLDKPMKNHTLMQTIARANRRAPGKSAGVIVDYVGVFQNLQKALSVYAAKGSDDKPIKDKDELVRALEKALGEAQTFCNGVGVNVEAIFTAQKLARLSLISQGVEALVAPDDRRRGFFRVAGVAARAYKALLPDERAAPYLKPVATLHVLAEAIRGKLGPVDISAVSAKIEALLDEKIEGVAITAPIIEGDDAGGRVDLSAIDFEKLAKLFATRPRTAAEKLRTDAEAKAQDMAARNPTRVHLVEKLEKLVEAYNLGTVDVDAFFAALKALIAEMEEEERRAARENLTEDELAIFDLLTRPEPKLTKAEEVAVKKVARDLLEKLQEQLAVFDWKARQQTRAAVETTIRFTLDELPQDPYPEPLWKEKVNAVWSFIFARQYSRAGGDASRGS
ncbi:type I restriction endonuclease subunit R [Hyphomicrobium sp. DMF-1]|jgi:type I restriction enzyme R subunit|uniref:type I restriction endonuclease subunit R n=1 Tax=Hyphomicrobium sp. DMF-1 TaxID=3019544 RepID=UPI0022EBFC91|nr:type I restriction endonuclease subunit R [Hyphomicrobium sp. DMF-1]WBT39959.1 type I restriction endonuclease subunit R [Hyphomicrobium sp. DMF-1]